MWEHSGSMVFFPVKPVTLWPQTQRRVLRKHERPHSTSLSIFW